jgi:hypothetical protein
MINAIKMQAGRCPQIDLLIFKTPELLILNQYFGKGNDNNRRRGFK